MFRFRYEFSIDLIPLLPTPNRSGSAIAQAVIRRRGKDNQEGRRWQDI
jgi:hypothetical protein